MTEHRLEVKVYLEDTDAQGIVYHANYLKFFERARTEILDTRGMGLANAQAQGLSFVVHEVRIKFHKPARLGDRLTVVTTFERASPFRLTFRHKAARAGEGQPLSSASVEAACIDAKGELVELTPSMLAV